MVKFWSEDTPKFSVETKTAISVLFAEQGWVSFKQKYFLFTVTANTFF